MNASRYLLLILGTVALLFLPFSNKAFHIDDFGFMAHAKAYSWNPLMPSSPVGDWVYESTHPFAFPYFYKILNIIFGTTEVAWHLAFIIFPLLAAFSLRSVSRSLFHSTPREETVLIIFFLAMPAFAVNAQNLMADAPTLSFILLALASYCRALDTDSIWTAYLGGISLCIAIFISYQAVFFVPAILLFVIARKKNSFHFISSVFIGPLLLLLWLLCVYSVHDVFPFIKSKSAKTIADEVKNALPAVAVRGKFIYILAMTGSSIALIFILRAFFYKKPQRILLALMATNLFLFLFFSNYLSGYAMGAIFVLSATASLGLMGLGFAVYKCIRDIRQGEAARGLLLLSWIGAVVFYNGFLLPFGSARYLLPALPPLILILANGIDLTSISARRAATAFGIVAVLFALSASLADYRFAETYRSMAKEVKDFRDAGEKSFDVWFIGDWGMRHYMEKAGARILTATSNDPKPGDFVILPEMPRFWAPSPRLQQRMATYATRDFRSELPLRLFNRKAQAGFYSHYAGLLPFSFSDEPDESFTILQVVKP